MTTELELRAASHDASHFLLTPRELRTPESAGDVASLMTRAARSGVPITFRAGGTSLSGQAVSSGTLADVRRSFRSVEVLDQGARVRCEPGLTVRQVNARLAPYGRKLGPDPASDGACTIGGMVADNSSGMSCGTESNSYRTLESMVVVLPSGTLIDTADPDADRQLRQAEPDLHAGLLELRRRVVENPEAVAKIRQQFSMKNTMGYGVNSLLDFDAPVDILEHLMVGSEGTLGFIASATLRTVPVRPFAATGLLVFEDLFSAARALPSLIATGAFALELMDATSLRVGQQLPDAPAVIRDLHVTNQAALLVEFQATSLEELDEGAQRYRAATADLPGVSGLPLTTDKRVRNQLWTMRKGLYTSVAGSRPEGSTALLEDVVVPVPALAQTCADLTRLFTKYGYRDAVIFGHAKDGNIHFMLTDDFQSPSGLARYRDFTEDMVDVILGHQGSLKAEHGTGRTMAPFVERQYGPFLYRVMRDIKALFDPRGLLNPDVIITSDPDLYLQDIKVVPPVSPLVDRCTACGHCEPVCPSKNLTLTPRQRIAGLREVVLAEERGEPALAGQLTDLFEYEGVDTCAVDGMCGTVCPLGIDTGQLVRVMRAERKRPVSDGAWSLAADHWGAVTRGASMALTVAHAIPPALTGAVLAADDLARKAIGQDIVPVWDPELPRGGTRRRRPLPTTMPVALYLPACVSSMFGSQSGLDVQDSLEQLCELAGVTLLVPPQIDSMCCGTVWSSKGIPRGYEQMRQIVLPVVRAWSRAGALPVVCDASSCTEGFAKMLAADPDLDVEVIDAVTFVKCELLPRLPQSPKLESLALHPTCSSKQIGIEHDLRAVAEAVAETVAVPLDWGCCAFAGDRGLLHPELTASATQAEAAEVRQIGAAAHGSCNRTCELGMTRATGYDYSHVIQLLAAQHRVPGREQLGGEAGAVL